MGWKLVGAIAAGCLLLGYFSASFTGAKSPVAASKRARAERDSAEASPQASPAVLARAPVQLGEPARAPERRPAAPAFEDEPVRDPGPAAMAEDEPAPPSPPPVSKEMMERISRLNGTGQVDAFLGDLEAQARAKRAVTAAEVQPGMMAIRSLQGSMSADEMIAKQIAFSREMLSLQQEFQAAR